MDALMIGVSGMRGTVGGTLTPEVVLRMSAAFVTWLRESAAPLNGTHYRVVVGRDSRPSGPFVRDAAVCALVACGAEVIDLNIVTTPGTAMMIKHTGADGGMVITASHNPVEWNGLKTLNSDAVALPPAAARRLKEIYDAHLPQYVRVGKIFPVVQNSETHALHVRRVTERVDVLGISSKRFKVVLDSVNGAGCVATATLLGKLGCNVVHLFNTPNGLFPHEPEPTEGNLVTLAAEVKRQKADIGFAQDPDADRLAIIDENGVYVGEEYSLALVARWLLGKKKGVAVTNLSTSRMIDDVAAINGSMVLRTAVGEANVIDTMLRHDAVVGGEGNGGVIDARIVPGRDSLVGMAYVLALMADTGKKLSEIIAELPRYEIVKTKFECRREDANRAVEALKSAFVTEKLDVQDGVRIDWSDGWVHARPSNTEPIMRVIAEAPDRAVAHQRIDAVRAVITKTLALPLTPFPK